MPPSATEFQLRCRPSQRRSEATFDVILQTAGALLDVHGAHGFTTNLLAEASRVSIRAIYRYFPNKQAVIAELAKRMESRLGAAVAAVGDLADVSRPWSELWVGYIDAFVDGVRSTPGALAILAAMRDDPVLRAVDEVANGGYIDGIVVALKARQPGLDGERARSIAVVLIRSTVAVLDEAFSADERTAASLIGTLKLMHVQLLDSVLEGNLR